MLFNPLSFCNTELVSNQFLEIIRLDFFHRRYEDNPKTFLIDEVEIGKKYELVISQLWGLYRYRFGDVIQVTGFYQNCPKVKFLYRYNENNVYKITIAVRNCIGKHL